MSAYCTTTEVNSLIKSITIDATSVVTAAEIDAMIIRISNTMDGVIVKKYTLPITDSEALSIRKDVAMKLTAADVIRTIHSGGMKPIPAIAQTWHDEAMKVLEGINENTFKLEAEDSTDIVQTGVLDANGNERKPTMRKEMKF